MQHAVCTSLLTKTLSFSADTKNFHYGSNFRNICQLGELNILVDDTFSCHFYWLDDKWLEVKHYFVDTDSWAADPSDRSCEVWSTKTCHSRLKFIYDILSSVLIGEECNFSCMYIKCFYVCLPGHKLWLEVQCCIFILGRCLEWEAIINFPSFFPRCPAPCHIATQTACYFDLNSSINIAFDLWYE